MDDTSKRLEPSAEVTFGPSMHRVVEVIPPRNLSRWEQAVVNRLLSEPFHNRDKVRKQLESARVSMICLHCPTVRVALEEEPSQQLVDEHGSPAHGSTPFELYGLDVDGMHITVLLRVSRGYVNLLEVVRADGQALVSVPEPERFEVVPLW